VSDESARNQPNERSNAYVFAHQALRSLVAKDPLWFLEFVAEEGEDGMKRFWDIVARKFVTPLPASLIEFEIQSCSVRRFPSVMIRLPQARRTGDAILAGIVVCAERDVVNSGEVAFRYFLLERRRGPNGACTAFCEWRRIPGGWRHVDAGDGPSSTFEAFRGWIEAAVCGEDHPVTGYGAVA
jgi:hypothetical protein